MPETTNAEDHRKTKKIKDNYLRQSLKSFNIYQVVSSLFWCSFVSYPVNASDFALGQSLMARGMDFPIYPSSRQLRTQYHPTLRNTIYYAGQFDDFTKCTVTLQTLFFSLIYVFNWEAAGVGHDTWQGRLHKSTLFQNHVDFIFILSVIVTCITIVFFILWNSLLAGASHFVAFNYNNVWTTPFGKYINLLCYLLWFWSNVHQIENTRWGRKVEYQDTLLARWGPPLQNQSIRKVLHFSGARSTCNWVPSSGPCL